jgi:hypothetical protein
MDLIELLTALERLRRATTGSARRTNPCSCSGCSLGFSRALLAQGLTARATQGLDCFTRPEAARSRPGHCAPGFDVRVFIDMLRHIAALRAFFQHWITDLDLGEH